MTNTTKKLATIAWAAERLGLSQRQVLRYVQAGTLHAVLPERGSRESGRHKRLLSTSEVRQLDIARTGHLRGDDLVCYPGCGHESHGNA